MSPTTEGIPALQGNTLEDMNHWFSDMAAAGLLFHPDDSPESIEIVATGERMFTDAQCRELDSIFDCLFRKHGNAVHDVCLSHAARLMGISPG